ncbi:unnamed protein product [Brachionus calyciflorus]|uniref:Transposase n=1 Tax=Brachionus calyciflorus TaxID=104777 RepID=A0A814SH56_9BILA|nr:unnamed protein product [Brachionus calyciflorus]
MGKPTPNILRELAISYFKLGKSNNEIFEILARKVSLRTVCRWMKDFRDHGKTQHFLPTGRPNQVYNHFTRKTVKRLVKNFSQRQIRSSSYVFGREDIYYKWRTKQTKPKGICYLEKRGRCLRGAIYKKKNPLSVMVWMGITKYGLTKPYFVKENETINSHFYKDRILPFAKREGNRLCGTNKWVFQQDGATPHTAKISQN